MPVEADGLAVAARLEGASSFEIFEMETPGGKVVNRQRVVDPVGAGSPGRGARLAVFLARRGVEFLLTGEQDLGSAPYYVLDASGVRVLSRPETTTVDDAEKALSDFATAYRPAGA